MGKRSMRALRLHEVGVAPVIDPVEVPALSAGAVLVRVRAAGICGSDHHIVSGHNPLPEYPRTLGHEVAGEVAAVAPDVRGIAIGDRVAVNFLVSCGTCDYCAEGRSSLCQNRSGIGVASDGGLADYVLIPQANAIPVPDSVPFPHAAIATDAFATPLHAIRRSGVRPGEACLVIGAGGLGLCAVQLLVALGAGPVTAVDRDATALEAALRAGASAALTPERLLEERPSAERILHAFDFVGSPETVLLAVEATGRGGRINVVGLNDRAIRLVRGDVLVREEKVVAGSYSFGSEEIRAVLGLMAEGRLSPDLVIGSRIGLGQAAAILDPTASHAGRVGRTVVVLDTPDSREGTVPA